MINIDDRIFEEVKTDSQMWLLLHIAKRINKDASCYPKNSTLAKDCGWGKNKVQKVKKELQELGLIQVAKRMVDGKQRANNYTVSTDYIGVFVPLSKIKPTPIEGTPKQGNLKEGTPKQGNRSINQLEVLTNINKDINGKKDLPEVSAPSFDEFWNNYNYKKNRKAAKKSWDRLTTTKKQAALAGIPQYLAYLNYSGHSQCHGATWLNGERWTDDNSIVKPTPQTKNLVESYRGHLDKYLNEKQLKLMNGKIQDLLSKAGENATQAKIKGIKANYSYIQNATFTESLIFDICYGTLSSCGTTPDRRFSKFRQWYDKLSDYNKNKAELRTEFKKHLNR